MYLDTKKKIGILAGLLLVISVNYLSAQQSQWTIITQKPNGLPSNWISDIDFDKNNLAWISTDSGLARYDGDLWLVYNKSNVGFKENTVTCVAVDSFNNKWVGTTPRLYLFDDKQWTLDSCYYDNIIDIVFDKKNNAWVNSYYSGIVYNDRVNKKIRPTLFLENNKKNRLFSNLVIDRNENLWCFAGDGYTRDLYRIKDSVWYHGTDTSREFTDQYDIKIDKNGLMWIVSLSHGLYSFDGTNWKNYNKYNSNITSPYLSNLAIDKNNNLWIIDESCLIYYDHVNFKIFNNSNSIINNQRLTCITIDSMDRKWIGSQNGLIIYSGNAEELSYTEKQDVKISNCSIYPNPTYGQLYISFDSKEQELIYLKIFDVEGRCLVTKKISEASFSYELDINQLSTGFYYVKLTNENGNIIKCEKIIKL